MYQRGVQRIKNALIIVIIIINIDIIVVVVTVTSLLLPEAE